MIKKVTFGPAEAIVLLALSDIARTFLPYPRNLVELAGAAAWMTPIGGMLIALGGIYLMSLVLKKNTEQTIIEITEQAFGPIIGTAVNILIIALPLVAVAALFIREFSEAILTTTLPSAPLQIIAISYLAAGLLGAYLGIEALARTARLSYPYVMVGLFFLILTLIPFWNFHNLLPLFGNGASRVFLNGSFSTAGVAEIILSAIIIQSMGGIKYYTRIGYTSMIISFGVFILMLFVLILTYNWPISQEFTLPFLRLSRTVYLGRFFQRMESLFIIVWSIIGCIKIAFVIYGATVSLCRSLKLTDYRPLLWPLGFIIFVLASLLPDLPLALEVDSRLIRPLMLVPSYLLPLLILIAYWFKGKGKLVK